MEEIKARVRRRRASGFYSEEEVRRVADMELEVSEVVPALRDELEHHLAAVNGAWDIVQEPVLSSHRPGVGRLIVGVKRLWLRVMRPYTRLVLQRQLEFNTALLDLLNAFVLPVRDKFPELAAQFSGRLEGLTGTMHDWLAAGRTEDVERHRALAATLDRQLQDIVGQLASLRA